jgi:hypothetical protein
MSADAKKKNSAAMTKRLISELGIAASGDAAGVDVAFVAPASSGSEHNTLRGALIPHSCFRREDAIFFFDSSFIALFDPEPLKVLLAAHPGSKLTIFGHADPVGRDDYNKTLSGRRAQAVFGLLTRDVARWADLYYRHDTQGNDPWGEQSVRAMLNRLNGGNDVGGTTDAAVRGFESKNGLAQKGLDKKGEIARPTFDKLALQYMDALCVDDDQQQFKLTKDDFLARGRHPQGKGDFQGCSEFNPTLLFSKADRAQLDRQENHGERNRRNQVNRRVMILLFPQDADVDPARWPCPSVKEGVAGCKKRFFSDADKRIANTDEEREFAKSKDTFACRFYHRLVAAAPCDAVKPFQQMVWLLTHPQASGRSDIELVVKDEAGQEVRRTAANSSESGPGSFLTFDLSEIERNKLYDVALRFRDVDLYSVFKFQPEKLRQALLAGDLQTVADHFLPAAKQGEVPPLPPTPDIDTAASPYEELDPVDDEPAIEA